MQPLPTATIPLAISKTEVKDQISDEKLEEILEAIPSTDFSGSIGFNRQVVELDGEDGLTDNWSIYYEVEAEIPGSYTGDGYGSPREAYPLERLARAWVNNLGVYNSVGDELNLTDRVMDTIGNHIISLIEY